jgi:hypothetical protein
VENQYVWLAMSMYETTLIGKYWYLELQEYLLEPVLKASESMMCLFIKTNDDGSTLYLLNYVNGMFHYGTNTPSVKHFAWSL